MSNESFRQFIEKVQGDDGLRQELLDASGEFGMPVEGVVAFAAARGYAFNIEEAGEPLPEPPSKGELSDAILDTVAGGGNPPEPMFPNPLSTFRALSGNLMFKF